MANLAKRTHLEKCILIYLQNSRIIMNEILGYSLEQMRKKENMIRFQFSKLITIVTLNLVFDIWYTPQKAQSKWC